MPAAQDVFERLLSNYTPEPNSGCWLWLLGLGTDGYGNISSKGFGRKFRAQSAHRVSWEFFKGPIPQDMCVLHRCDVRSCVNPDHLFLGTRADNNTDKQAKGRASLTPGQQGLTKGENNAMAKLSKSDVIMIRESEENWKVLAKRYGVHHQTIWKIRRGFRWGDR
jgi:hypothetical protein